MEIVKLLTHLFGRHHRVKVSANYCTIFGDSHQALYSLRKRISVNHVGPITMHRVGRDGIGVFRLDKADILEGDAIGFVFGEIDVRVHIDRQVKLGRYENQVIDQLVSSYFQTLDQVETLYPKSRIIVFAVVPPAGLDYPSFDPGYPRNGSDDDRSRWTNKLNAALASHAKVAGYVFIDQYSPFANENGLLHPNATSDGVHVNCNLATYVDLSTIFERI